MRFCGGAFAKVLYICRKPKKTQPEMVAEIFRCFDLAYQEDASYANKFIACSRPVPSSVITGERTEKYDDMLRRFKLKVIDKLIDPAKEELLIHAALDILAKDDNVPKSTVVDKELNLTKTDILEQEELLFPDLLFGMLRYCIDSVKNLEGATHSENITAEYVGIFRGHLGKLPLIRDADPKKQIMIAEMRKSRTDAEFGTEGVTRDEILRTLLYNEVGGRCPYPKDGRNCGTVLYAEKSGEHLPNFEIVQIDVKGNDVTANKIMLCRECAERFKFNTTAADVRALTHIKGQLSLNSEVSDIKNEHDIDVSIEDIIRALTLQTDAEREESKKQLEALAGTALRYSPKRITDKIPDEHENRRLISEIRQDVQENYCFIEDVFNRLKSEPVPPGKKRTAFKRICLEVQECCDKMSGLKPKREIYRELVNWLQERTKSDDYSSCRIIISFFVQNCEVFSDETA